VWRKPVAALAGFEIARPASRNTAETFRIEAMRGD
jgi:hypothetical protein